MSDHKRLAFSIIQFLQQQMRAGGLSGGAQESLEVAVQCLETAFEVSSDDQTLSVPLTLPEIFAAATTTTSTSSVNNNSLSEEQQAEAERLKSDGNEQMKVENYAAAVSFYSKAISINPQNAVYYCNRAAALSKLSNYSGAVQDCERAINIDPNYSKAYGRMGLALSSLNRHSEAVTFYQKALQLDPGNESYRSNMKIAMDKTQEPQGAGVGGVDLAGLLSNPGFMNMASSLMNNPQVQQLMSGMMAGAYGGVGGATGTDSAAGGGSATATGGGGASAMPGATGDLSGLIQAGQQFAQQMQQQNPELIEQLRNQMRNRTPSSSNEEQN